MAAKESRSSSTGCAGTLVGADCENKELWQVVELRMFRGVRSEAGDCSASPTMNDHPLRRFESSYLLVIPLGLSRGRW